MKVILIAIFGLWIAGGISSSCSPYIANPCDTCSLNQDSLEKIKDSLAHSFEWKQYSIPGEIEPSGVWVFGENDIYVTGNHLFHFDGISFTEILLKRISNGTGINVADDALFAFSKTDFWIVGGNAFHSIDGIHAEDLRPDIDIKSCWGTSSNDMFFVGKGGFIYHYDGVNFTKMVSNTTENLLSVWGTDHNHVWACGQGDISGKSVMLFYDGNNWSVDNNLSNDSKAQYSGLIAVRATDSGSHPTVISTGAYAFRKTDDQLWRADTVIPNIAKDHFIYVMYVLTANASNDVFASSDYNWVGHWNGKTWKSYDSLIYDSGFSKAGGISMKGNTVCVVGVKHGDSWVAIGQREEVK
jgi:hypothetical protein